MEGLGSACAAHVKRNRRMTTQIGSGEAMILNTDPPALELHGGDQSNTKLVILCNRSCCAMRPALLHAHLVPLAECRR